MPISFGVKSWHKKKIFRTQLRQQNNIQCEIKHLNWMRDYLSSDKKRFRDQINNTMLQK